MNVSNSYAVKLPREIEDKFERILRVLLSHGYQETADHLRDLRDAWPGYQQIGYLHRIRAGDVNVHLQSLSIPLPVHETLTIYMKVDSTIATGGNP